MRSALNDSLGEARVGAVLEIDGEALSVVRLIAHSNRGVANPGTDLEQLGQLEKLPAKDSLAEYLQKLAGVLSTESLDDPWSTFLQSCTRDQETRLTDVATWRVPARGGNQTRQDTLLKLLDLYSYAEAEEHRSKGIGSDEKKADTKSREYASFRAQALRARLTRSLEVEIGGDDLPVLAAAFRRVAKARLEKVEAGSSELRAAEAKIHELTNRLADIAAEKGKSEEAVRRLGGMTHMLSTHLLRERRAREELKHARWRDDAGTCPTCGQAVNNSTDREHVRQERERLAAKCEQDIRDISENLRRHEDELTERTRLQSTQSSEQTQVKGKLERAQADLDTQRRRHVELVTHAKITLTEADEYASLVQGVGHDATPKPPEKPELPPPHVQYDFSAETSILERRDRFRQLYDNIARLILGDEVETGVSFSANTVTAQLRKNGETRSVLDVLIFDLVAMTMRGEGAVQGPAFLVHDSPHETDMGLLYFNYLNAFQELEKRGGPFFQSFVTTTTAPPKPLMGRVRLRLRGAPDEARLLGRAL